VASAIFCRSASTAGNFSPKACSIASLTRLEASSDAPLAAASCKCALAWANWWRNDATCAAIRCVSGHKGRLAQSSDESVASRSSAEVSPRK
jgi:hypothetical protein